MILPIILSVVSVASAQHMVAGVGRLSLGVNTPGASASANVDVEFNSNVLSSAIGSIVSSLTEGPNRTSSSVLPVSKVYGVSVRSCSCFETHTAQLTSIPSVRWLVDLRTMVSSDKLRVSCDTTY